MKKQNLIDSFIEKCPSWHCLEKDAALLKDAIKEIEEIISDHEHNFQILKKDYWHQDGKENFVGKTYNQSITYSMLYCTKCGETKEVISQIG